jgi:hypothetical protein
MKIIYQFIFAAILFFFCSVSFAQEKEKPVRFANGNFLTKSNIKNQTFKTEDISISFYESDYYVLVQFTSLPTAGIKQQLKIAGVQLISYLPDNAFLATIKKSFDFRRPKEFNISSINVVPPAYKIHRKVFEYLASENKEDLKAMAVTYYAGTNKAVVLAALRSLGAVILSEKMEAGSTILIQCNASVINAVASLPFVTSVSLQNLKDKPLNYNSRAAHGVSGLNAFNGKNLNGKGVTVGIGDNADISTHIDFAGRLINRCPSVPDNHGTHTSGTASGAGIIDIKNRGMAARSTIVSQYFSDIIFNTPAYITDYDMVVTNNSYHNSENGCVGAGEYNALSNYADNQIKNNDHVLHVFASGNDGDSTCAPYAHSFKTVRSGWQCAKNVLTVGALNANNYTITNFSCRGPVDDGRIKPEIIADGAAVISTKVNNNYGPNSGTSMSCPAVTGALALMYERYRQLHEGANPTSALMKAIVCNTAEDLGNTGPDYSYGFGMLNARRAVEAIDSNRFYNGTLTNGANTTHTITVPANTRQVKIMLYWADVPAVSNAAISLVNDLDLVVTDPASSLHRPLVLNASVATVNSPAVEGPDHLNNIEQVMIDNPAAGVYSIKINGYNVPIGSQDYVISYEIVKNSVVLEYPTGGETLVPGETENIRWNGYTNSPNAYTLEFSADNGTDWSTINNDVASNLRVYAWTVPSTVTKNALLRISKNGTSLSDESNFNFNVLGQPTLTLTNVCAGSVQLNWNGITGATSYDILQLTGDTMRVIANSTGLSHLLTGLDRNKTYWLAVTAKNGTSSGRRSLAVSVRPNTGACSLPYFNNDLRVDTIVEPQTARQFFLNAANATKPVTINIKNYGSTTVTGPFDVSFNYGSGTVTESINPTINAGSTYSYTFTGMYPVIAAGYLYNFKAWVTKLSDANHLNDTAYKTVKYINNAAITLPLIEDFESMDSATFMSNELAIGGNKFLDFFTNTTRGRARSFVNTGIAYNSKQALTLDQAPYSTSSTTDSAIFNFNLSQYASKQLRCSFLYQNHSQADAPGNRVWIRGSENSNWVEAYNLFLNQGEIGEWKKAIININDLLTTASPVQTVTPTFQLKLGQQGNTSVNTVSPQVDVDDGYTFDNVVLSEALDDVSMVTINAPDKKGCALSATNPVSIKIKNFNNITLNNVQVNYQINNGAIVSEIVPSIAPNQALDYTFAQTANLSAYINYSINVWVKYATDNYDTNDSILNYVVHSSPIITSYPYLQEFETDDGGFYTSGNHSTWQWGTPLKTVVNKAANGSKIWTTNLHGNYTDNETSYLNSPCFDLAGLNHPVLSFSHIFDVEFDYDFTWVEYTTDGITWKKLGLANSGTNWYDYPALNNWRVSKKKWHVASINIPVTNTTIRFRFVITSDGGVTAEGIGIDDVRIHEQATIAGSPAPLFPKEENGPWANNWISFNYGDSLIGPWYVVGEINSFGQDLGTVTIQPYVNHNPPVRNSGNQYYLDKSFVISSTIAPTSPVAVRLYVSDGQVNSLINASGCVTCGKPVDAYGLGVQNFSGDPRQVNGVLEDDYRDFQFIAPYKTIPHGIGYYAEFITNRFGEFWFSKGDMAPLSVSECPGSTVTYTASLTGTIYQWQVDDGTGYTNVTNGINYTGATSSSLQLINVPTSYTGNKYRCVVNGANGVEYTLRFKNVWTGATNTDWFTASNWFCGSVPDENTDVIIGPLLPNYPVLTANTAVRSLRAFSSSPTINAGVILTITAK